MNEIAHRSDEDIMAEIAEVSGRISDAMHGHEMAICMSALSAIVGVLIAEAPLDRRVAFIKGFVMGAMSRAKDYDMASGFAPEQNKVTLN